MERTAPRLSQHPGLEVRLHPGPACLQPLQFLTAVQKVFLYVAQNDIRPVYIFLADRCRFSEILKVEPLPFRWRQRHTVPEPEVASRPCLPQLAHMGFRHGNGYQNIPAKLHKTASYRG